MTGADELFDALLAALIARPGWLLFAAIAASAVWLFVHEVKGNR